MKRRIAKRRRTRLSPPAAAAPGATSTDPHPPPPPLPDREGAENLVEHVVEGHAPTTTTTCDQQQTTCSHCFDEAYHDPLLPCTCTPSPPCEEVEDEDDENDDEEEAAMVVGGEGEEHVDTTAAAVEKEEEEKAAMSRLVMRFGVSCHACKVLQPRLWVCPRAPAHRWCAKCLRNRFGVAFAAAPAWPGLATARGCPACRGHCPCAACRRSGGSQPHQNSSGRPRMTTAAAAATEQPQRDGGGGGGTAERRERGFGRLMHEEHHDWTKVLDRDAYRSSLVFRKRFLSEAEGEGLVEVLRGCEDQMRYHRFVVMGKKTEHLEPRATLCFGSTVAYHGVTVVTQPWSKAPPELIALKKKMVDELKVEVNSFLCTRYLNGLQYIGKHADDQANVKDGRVVTVSLGAERDFCFEDRGAGKKWIVSLPHRSLYIMEGDFQKHLEHWIPAAPEVKSERWSITARFLLNVDDSHTTR